VDRKSGGISEIAMFGGGIDFAGIAN